MLNQIFSSNHKCHHINPCESNSELNMNLETECDKKSQITYELNSQNSLSPIPYLKKNQSMLFQNISPEIERTEPSKKYIPRHQNILYKSHSTNFGRRNVPCSNREIIKNNMNKKNELLEKIRYISNRIDKSLNLYKDKNCENHINNNNNRNYSNKFNISKKIDKSKINNSNNRNNEYGNFALNFKYNSKMLETLKKDNIRQNKLINSKTKNLSQVINEPNNIYNKMDNKRKMELDKLNKQKKFYVDNNNNNIKNMKKKQIIDDMLKWINDNKNASKKEFEEQKKKLLDSLK